MSSLVRAALVALLVAGSSVGCADRDGASGTTPKPGSGSDGSGSGSAGGGSGEPDMTQPSIQITKAGERPGRPPLVRVLVNVVASNPGSGNLWVLVPRKVPADPGGVDKLEQLTAGTAILGRFLGNGGFYAALLGPGATLTIKNLEIGWWSEGGGNQLSLDVRTGSAISLGGTDIATWYDKSPAITGTVVVDVDQAQHTFSKRSPTEAEVEVQVTGEQHQAIAVPL